MFSLPILVAYLFWTNPYSGSRGQSGNFPTDLDELEHRLSLLDGEIQRECVLQGMCPEETPKVYAEAVA